MQFLNVVPSAEKAIILRRAREDTHLAIYELDARFWVQRGHFFRLD
ncbi:hypothetical protein [Hyphomicrobium album]|nr:hypothetical protein [Hyphomicrobium album]